MVDFVLEMGKRLSHALSDGLPDEARQHLVNAQRELITALVLIYEHRVTTGGPPARRRAGPSRSPRKTPSRRRASRVSKIPVE